MSTKYQSFYNTWINITSDDHNKKILILMNDKIDIFIDLDYNIIKINK